MDKLYGKNAVMQIGPPYTSGCARRLLLPKYVEQRNAKSRYRQKRLTDSPKIAFWVDRRQSGSGK